MSELTALTQFAFRRHRVVSLGLIALSLIGVTTGLALTSLFPEYDRGQLLGLPLFFTLLPTGLAAMGLFDYGQEKDLMSPYTGCNEWVLRMPIESWKIAIVPVLLKSAWVAGTWGLFVWSISGTEESVPLLGPWLAMSAIVIWLLVIAWRPVQSGWTRLIAMVVTAPTLFCLYALVVNTGVQPESVWYLPSCLLAAVACGLGLATLIRTTSYAKSAVSGKIPVSPSRFAMPDAFRGTDRKRHFSSPFWALAWNDYQKTRTYILYALVLGVVPTVVITTLFVPLSAKTIGVVMFLFAYWGMIAVGGTKPTSAPNQSTLPPYLVASPISTATIAWTRLFTVVAITFAIGSCCLFAFLGWALSESNRSNWYAWASEQATLAGSPDQVVWTGTRLSVAIVMGIAIVLGGRLVSFQWIGMIGRSWINMTAIMVFSIASAAVGGVFLWWFIRQTDWESTVDDAMRALAWLPTIVISLLVIKLIGVVASGITLARSRLVSANVIVQAIGGWIAFTIAVAAILFALIPDARATFVWCLALTTLAVPLARLLILPVSLNLNRHR